MGSKLHYDIASDRLLDVLRELMSCSVFSEFRLVGGTALALQRGHRVSVDIDLFTDKPYGSIDFEEIEKVLKRLYAYVDFSGVDIIGPGRSYFVGPDDRDNIKLDIYYTDEFIDPPLVVDGLKLATVDEIVAMKLNVILQGGRKKDFWDIHELIDTYTLIEMLNLHQRRYPYNHDRHELLSQLVNFTIADRDFDPVCRRHKVWELLRLDFVEWVRPSLP